LPSRFRQAWSVLGLEVDHLKLARERITAQGIDVLSDLASLQSGVVAMDEALGRVDARIRESQEQIEELHSREAALDVQADVEGPNSDGRARAQLERDNVLRERTKLEESLIPLQSERGAIKAQMDYSLNDIQRYVDESTRDRDALVESACHLRNGIAQLRKELDEARRPMAVEDATSNKVNAATWKER
jgi:hypothetical protein